MSIESTLRLLRPAIRELQAYKSARSLGMTGSVFLDANESPWAPTVGSDLNRYPDPQPPKLMARLAELYGVRVENLVAGRGSDDAIDFLVRAFCEAGQDAILICPPTYGVYEVAANIQGAEVRRLPTSAENDFALDPERVIAAWTSATKIVFVCSPNNPTGNLVPAETIAAIASGLEDKALVVVDEAYIEFAKAPSFTTRLADHPNVVVLRTLSKAWALAGARLGVAIGHPDLIAVLQKVRAPYPIPAPAAQAVQKAIDERGLAACQDRVAKLVAERERVATELAKIDSIEKVFPSDANFLLLRAREGAQVMQRCLDRGIVVRDRNSEIVRGVRITIGSPAENDLLLAAIAGREATAKAGRTAKVTRTTRETAIEATVDLDGEGTPRVDTGLKYFDHMLEQLSKHGGFDLTVKVQGDLEVDEHHTVEDTAIVIGECLNKALGDRVGIERYGFLLPMDEAEAKVALDLSGRPYLVFEGTFPREYVGELPTELVSHFFRSLSDSLRATLHVAVTGENAHHMVEACFKGVGRALRQAISKSGRGGLPSTKGVL